MTITADTRVAEIAATEPATIKVFQQHQIDFCCGGKIPLGEAMRAARYRSRDDAGRAVCRAADIGRPGRQ